VHQSIFIKDENLCAAFVLAYAKKLYIYVVCFKSLNRPDVIIPANAKTGSAL
jgi:hypothetical protein